MGTIHMIHGHLCDSYREMAPLAVFVLTVSESVLDIHVLYSVFQYPPARVFYDLFIQAYIIKGLITLQ